MFDMGRLAWLGGAFLATFTVASVIYRAATTVAVIKPADQKEGS
jgi:hypothetical protein